MAKVTNLKIQVQEGTTDTLYATWGIAKKYTNNAKDPKNRVKNYKVIWRYATGDGVYFDGSESDEDRQLSTYSPPEHATTVKVIVKPVSKTYKSGGKDKAYFTGENVSETFKMTKTPPVTPGSPNIELKDYNIILTLDGITDKNTDKIQFKVINDITGKRSDAITADVIGGRASAIYKASPGGKYRAHCRAVNVIGSKKEYSEWSEYTTEQVFTKPNDVSNVNCIIDTDTSIRVTWNETGPDDRYSIEYTTEEKYFDTSSLVTPVNNIEHSPYFLTGLEPGHTYFIRVRAENDSGESAWVQYNKGIVLGTKPTIPTTWSSSSTAMVGEKVSLHWIHNSEDGSYQRRYQIQVIINDGGTPIEQGGMASTTEEDSKNGYYTYELNLSGYNNGAEVLWRVKTKGIHAEWSDWSMQRTIKLYAPPTVSISANDILNMFPYRIQATAGPSSQTALKFHTSIVAMEDYTTEDATGTEVRVNAGTEVYSEVFVNNNNNFSVTLMPYNVSLANNRTYAIKITAAMDTGLTAEATKIFEVSWSDETYDPDASVVYDEDTLTCVIYPECTDDDGNLISNIALSVYRREYDGTFVEIATGIRNDGVSAVVDPHPALDFARYRIVATSANTGNIGYSDLPGEPIGEPAIVIQWDEQWTNFDYNEESAPETPPWTGSLVKLPYNVDVSENRDLDVSLIEYIGRSHPVSYYGTQRGETASWSTEVPKTDKETIYALRRLAVWRGDVYVREPSGTGYWAQISVSMSNKHKELTVPVTFDITRVEGGK